MERHDVVVLEINLDEGFSVAGVFLDLHAVEHEAGEIQIGADAQAREVARHVSFAAKQQAVPVLQRSGAQIEAGVAGKMRCAEQPAVEAVGPAVQWADQASGVAAILGDDGLAVAADIADELHAVAAAQQRLGVIERGQHLVIAAFWRH